MDQYDVYHKMFNPNFILSDVLSQCMDYLIEEVASYEDLIGNETINILGERYVHVSSFGPNKSVSRRAMERRIPSLPAYSTHVSDDCPFHRKGHCRLVEHDVGFVCYLQGLATQEAVADGDNETVDLRRAPTPQDDDFEDICEDYEREEALKLDKATIKYGNVISETHVSDEAIKNNDIPIPCLPSFIFDGREYVLLHDIQVLFELREDYALATLAQNLEGTEWVLEDPNLGSLQTMYDPEKALELCFREAKEYEKELPTEEEFQDAQASIREPGRVLALQEQRLLQLEEQSSEHEVKSDNDPIIKEPEDQNVGKHKRKSEDVEKSVNLWTNKSVYGDENSMVHLFLLCKAKCMLIYDSNNAS